MPQPCSEEVATRKDPPGRRTRVRRRRRPTEPGRPGPRRVAERRGRERRKLRLLDDDTPSLISQRSVRAGGICPVLLLSFFSIETPACSRSNVIVLHLVAVPVLA